MVDKIHAGVTVNTGSPFNRYVVTAINTFINNQIGSNFKKNKL